jgi:type IV secretion system protein VirB6
MMCAPLSTDSGASLAGALASLDCQVNGAVATGYAHVFGAGGALGLALSIGLTLYLAILAIGLLTGHTQLTLGSLAPKVLTLGFVLTFATAWPAYQTVVYGLLTGGPDQVASAFMGARAGATEAFAGRLDSLFDAVLDIGRALGAAPKAANLGLATDLVWSSALILLVSTLGLLVIARIVLAVLLALGPIFIVFALFDGTRGLFEGWLRTAVGFALAPLLIVLGGSGLMAVLGPVIDAVADDPVRAAAEMRPVATLFVVSVVYAGLVLALGGAALALTRAWTLGRARLREAGAGGERAADARPPRLAATAATTAAVRTATDDRVAGVAAAVVRDGGRTSPAVAAATVGEIAPAAARTAARRVERLGQAFRRPGPARPLSGALER